MLIIEFCAAISRTPRVQYRVRVRDDWYGNITFPSDERLAFLFEWFVAGVQGQGPCYVTERNEGSGRYFIIEVPDTSSEEERHAFLQAVMRETMFRD